MATSCSAGLNDGWKGLSRRPDLRRFEECNALPILNVHVHREYYYLERLMWSIETEDDYDRSFKWYEKKRPKELRAVLTNLEKIMLALEAGAKPAQLQGGFIHREPQGVIAVSQQGGGKNLQATRLYLFVNEEAGTVHLIVIGDKREQSRDLKLCKKVVDRILAKFAPTDQLSKPDDSDERKTNVDQQDIDYKNEETIRERQPDGGSPGGEP